jgi:hypothetical protein
MSGSFQGELVGITTAVFGLTSCRGSCNRMGVAIAIDEARPVVAALVAQNPALPVARSARHYCPSDSPELGLSRP